LNWFLFLVTVGILAYLLFRPREELPSGMDQILSALNTLEEKGWDFFVRPDGSIDGVVTDDDEYFHDKFGKHRRKWIYYDRNGQRREEDRFMFNETTQGFDDMRAISAGSGGVIVTMRKSHEPEPDEGEKEPILIGPKAREKIDVAETFKAIEEEQNRTIEGLRKKEEDYRKVQRRYADLQNRVKEIEDENREYVKTIRDQSTLIDRLKAENEDLEAELKETKDQLERKREELKQVEEEAQETLEKTLERREAEAEAEAVS